VIKVMMMKRIFDNQEAVLHIAGTGDGTLFIVAVQTSPPAEPARAALEMYREIAGVLTDRGAAPVHERVFGSLSLSDTTLEARHQAFSDAVIDETGRSLHPGDAAGQISCTLEKLETLLSGAGATLLDVAAATVFVKTPPVADHFSRIAAERGLDDFPGVPVVADVCRRDLLFEIDAEVLLPAAKRRV
jgi:enamine deaminase RidA (YjgF/YER057c/UK114 family)